MFSEVISNWKQVVRWYPSNHASLKPLCLCVSVHQARITESQNCRGWNGPTEIIESTPYTKAGTLQWVAQVGIQMTLEYLHNRRLHYISGQPVPVLCQPYSKAVLHVSTELRMYKF